MTTTVVLAGDIEPALAYGFTQIGKPYDHQANTQARFGERKFDCSGLVTRCLWEGGMPRYHAGFGEGSASMAAWCERHPEFRRTIDNAKRTRGAILVYGGLGGIGDAGHVVFSLGDGRTLESNGRRGVCIDNVNRLAWSHGMVAPVHYGTAPTPPPAQGDDDMTPEQDQRLKNVEAYLGNLAKPGGLHDINERLATVEKALFNPGAAPKSILQDIQADTTAIRSGS